MTARERIRAAACPNGCAKKLFSCTDAFPVSSVPHEILIVPHHHPGNGPVFACTAPDDAQIIEQLAGEVATLKARIEKAPHAVTCLIQAEPHCEHCHDPIGGHFWDVEWAKDGGCKDHRGRPRETKWSPLPPHPCNCWKSEGK